MEPELEEVARVHRGRIERVAKEGWTDYWSYKCYDCRYGAGGIAGRGTWDWLMKTAVDHADPSHWSRHMQRPRRAWWPWGVSGWVS